MKLGMTLTKFSFLSHSKEKFLRKKNVYGFDWKSIVLQKQKIKQSNHNLQKKLEIIKIFGILYLTMVSLTLVEQII